MNTKKNGFTLSELMVVIVIIAILASMIGAGGACVGIFNIEKSNGARVGVVNKLSKKGVIWQTYEGEMALEGFSSTGTTVGMNIWQFSLDGNAANQEEMAKLIDEAMNSGKKVKVTYKEILGSVPWRGSTGYYLQKVESLNQKQSSEK